MEPYTKLISPSPFPTTRSYHHPTTFPMLLAQPRKPKSRKQKEFVMGRIQTQFHTRIFLFSLSLFLYFLPSNTTISTSDWTDDVCLCFCATDTYIRLKIGFCKTLVCQCVQMNELLLLQIYSLYNHGWRILKKFNICNHIGWIGGFKISTVLSADLIRLELSTGISIFEVFCWHKWSGQTKWKQQLGGEKEWKGMRSELMYDALGGPGGSFHSITGFWISQHSLRNKVNRANNQEFLPFIRWYISLRLPWVCLHMMNWKEMKIRENVIFSLTWLLILNHHSCKCNVHTHIYIYIHTQFHSV